MFGVFALEHTVRLKHEVGTRFVQCRMENGVPC